MTPAGFLVMCALLAASAANAAGEEGFWRDGVPYSGPVQLPDDPEGQYWLQLPYGFSADHPWPLILFFPGRMYGKTPEQTNFLKPEFGVFRERCRERGYVVCSVGRLSNMWMNRRARKLTDACLAHVKTKVPIDERRIYAAGLSMGGGAALTYARFRPRNIRAVCNFMGCTDFSRFYREGHYNESLRDAFGGTPDEVPDVYAAQSAVSEPEAYRYIPIITIHGDRDTCIPVWNATALWERIEGFHNGSRCVILKGVEHTNKVVQGLEDNILDVFQQAGKQHTEGGW